MNRHYPTPQEQLSAKQPCCTQDNLQPYDCGCHSGCSRCWALYHCATCHRKYGAQAKRALPQEGTQEP